MQEMQGLSLGQEDPLEKGMATHFSILAWKFPWREEPAGLQSWATVHGFAKSRTQPYLVCRNTKSHQGRSKSCAWPLIKRPAEVLKFSSE